MPSFVHNVKIVSTADSSSIQNGDAFLLAPFSTSKTYLGSGSSNTGDVSGALNLYSMTRVDDEDIIDASILKTGVKA